MLYGETTGGERRVAWGGGGHGVVGYKWSDQRPSMQFWDEMVDEEVERSRDTELEKLGEKRRDELLLLSIHSMSSTTVHFNFVL